MSLSLAWRERLGQLVEEYEVGGVVRGVILQPVKEPGEVGRQQRLGSALTSSNMVGQRLSITASGELSGLENR